ncbi:thiamine phosphate synthase [Flaviflagellibacter deserti]|uniref:Thiamine phosphate synthase n=1 Tax=Flaviflagellibacter deserti TaxID=2267266 RepID=A0ABV9Z3F5_9HYPH
MNRLPRLLIITDRTQAKTSVEEVVGKLCGSGCGWILFRDKDIAPAERRDMALRLREITRGCGSRLSVSTDVALAAEIGADGVHLQRAEDIGPARELLGSAWVGLSAHSLGDVGSAKEAGADYVTLSPIFPTESKPGYGPALGLETIRLAAEFAIPVFALGGVTPTSAHPCIEAGAYGLAVMGTVMRADDPAAIVREYGRAFSTSARRAG